MKTVYHHYLLLEGVSPKEGFARLARQRAEVVGLGQVAAHSADLLALDASLPAQRPLLLPRVLAVVIRRARNAAQSRRLLLLRLALDASARRAVCRCHCRRVQALAARALGGLHRRLRHSLARHVGQHRPSPRTGYKPGPTRERGGGGGVPSAESAFLAEIALHVPDVATLMQDKVSSWATVVAGCGVLVCKNERMQVRRLNEQYT